MRTAVILVLIFIYSLASAVVMYAVEDGTKARLMTTLEVVSVNSTHVIVNNTGNNTASMLTSTPSATFTPPTIGPGETAVGRFNSSIHSYTTIRIESKEGSSVVYTYRED
ncbi:hypothetical protein [Candidatus Pyrohabitans sp.]